MSLLLPFTGQRSNFEIDFPYYKCQTESTMSEYLIRIRNGEKNTCRKRRFFKRKGFTARNSHWEKIVGASEIRRWKRFARRKKFRFDYVDAKYARSTNYRQIFFSHYKPYRNGKYFCIYCGRLLPKEKIQVDHIIPVHAAQTEWFIQRYLKRNGWESINDYRNLGASCRRCNSRKGAKMGVWVWRGFRGKSNRFQVVRRTVRRILVMGIVILALVLIKKWIPNLDMLKMYV